MSVNKNIEYGYFALPYGLGGRGGALRFFFLDQGFNITETTVCELMNAEAWGKEKKALIEKNLPSSLPWVKYEGDQLFGHTDIARFFSRLLGFYGKDAKADYKVDAVNDFYIDWRAAWATAAFGDDKAKQDYEARRPHLYAFYETRIPKEGEFLFGKEPLWVDYFVAALIRDESITFPKADNLLEKNPKLNALVKNIYARPNIAAWIKKAEGK
eukprot:TRINITY_DN22041_c0_g1_i1.p2 TRINITY_DN22041_c0_g1~~TRINITY_DN22041_c0_g1_i1.p2  ORF type:complete len:233 (+),score=42.27 TRINITY_DN22041_c0_g1_i1:62-700(+)